MNISVFCGSSIGNNKIYSEKAVSLGEEFLRQDIDLIYGAGSVGLMGVIAETILSKNGRVVGVVPKFLEQKEVVHQNLTEIHLTETMSERKDLIIQLSDAFIAMPGGFGTFDELTEVLTLLQLEQSEKAVALYNINGYFDSMIEQIKRGVEEKFIRKEHADSLIISDNPKEIIQLCKDFIPPKLDKWIDDLKNKNTY